ncbi:MAG: hypothetical protein H0T57_07355 [Rubrobacter sp.]|nr:hypothetical protein [Rubrobacter sp.]MDQ3638332.1 hypothetical protein [Actinomycetota bacterium]
MSAPHPRLRDAVSLAGSIRPSRTSGTRCPTTAPNVGPAPTAIAMPPRRHPQPCPGLRRAPERGGSRAQPEERQRPEGALFGLDDVGLHLVNCYPRRSGRKQPAFVPFVAIHRVRSFP